MIIRFLSIFALVNGKMIRFFALFSVMFNIPSRLELNLHYGSCDSWYRNSSWYNSI